MAEVSYYLLLNSEQQQDDMFRKYDGLWTYLWFDHVHFRCKLVSVKARKSLDNKLQTVLDIFSLALNRHHSGLFVELFCVSEYIEWNQVSAFIFSIFWNQDVLEWLCWRHEQRNANSFWLVLACTLSHRVECTVLVPFCMCHLSLFFSLLDLACFVSF